MEISGNVIRLALLRRLRKKDSLEGLIRLEAPSDNIEDVRRTLTDGVRRNGLTGTPAAMILQDPRILHRAFALPKMSQKEIDAVVPFEARKAFGVRRDFRIVYHVHTRYREEGVPKIEVLAAAVPGEIVQNALDLIRAADLVPYYLMSLPFVQSQLPSAALISETEETVAHLHITRMGVDLTVTRGGHFLFSRLIRKEIDFSRFDMTPMSAEPASFENDGMEILSIAEETTGEKDDPFERLCTEINRSFLYVKQQNKESVKRIRLTGEGKRFPNLVEQLQHHLKLPLTVLENLPGLDRPVICTPAAGEEGEYDLCVAVAKTPSIFSTANLLPEEEQLEWKKRSAQRIAKVAYMVTSVLVLFLYVQLSYHVYHDQVEARRLRQGYARVDHRFEGVRRTLQVQSDRLLRRALCRGLTSASIPPEDVLAALALYAPDTVVLKQLVVQGGSRPFFMRLSGRIVLPDYSGGEKELDHFLNQCKKTGLFKTVRGRIGAAADQGESGRVQVASVGRRRIPIEIEGE